MFGRALALRRLDRICTPRTRTTAESPSRLSVSSPADPRCSPRDWRTERKLAGPARAPRMLATTHQRAVWAPWVGEPLSCLPLGKSTHLRRSDEGPRVLGWCG